MLRLIHKIAKFDFHFKFLILLFVCSFSQGQGQTIVSDDFENVVTLFTSSGSPLYFSGNSAAGSGPGSSPLAQSGTYSIGKSGGAVAVLTSSLINTSSCTTPQLTFKLASFSIGSTGNGADVSDYVRVEISPDGGTTFYNTLEINGNSNAYWGFTSGTGIASTAYDGNITPVVFAPAGGAARTTDGYSTITVTGLPTVTNLVIRISFDDDSNEQWNIDNFVLSGTCVSCTAPTTTISPTTQTFCAGSVTSMSVNSSAASNSYTWQASANGSSGWSNVTNAVPAGAVYSGSNTSVLTVTTASTYYYRCLVTDITASCTATSGTSTLVVNTAPSITLQPVNANITTSGTATFFAGVTGSGLTYQWQENSGSGFSNISNGGTNPTYSGATTSSLAITNTPLSMSGYSYQCIVTNACGSATTSVRVLTVTDGPCVSETFGNLASNSTYNTKTWTGDNGFTWSATDSRSDQVINGNAVTVRAGSLTANSVTGGIGNLTLVTKLNFADVAGNLSIYVNGVLVGTAAYSSTTQTITINNINVLGTFNISIVSASGARVSIDNVSWTCYVSPNTITTGTVSSSPFALTSCTATAAGTVDFSSVGTFNGGNVYTAQLSNSGGSFASPITIGTLTSTSNSGTINITIPAGTASGTGYLIRIISSNPNIIGSNSSAITITLTCTGTSTCTVSGAMGSNQINAGCGETGLNACNLASIYSSFGTFCNATENGGCSSPACTTASVSSVYNLPAGCSATITAEYKQRGTGCSNSAMDSGDQLYITNSGGTVSSQSSSMVVGLFAGQGTCGTYPSSGTYTTSTANINGGCANANGIVSMIASGGQVTVGGVVDRGDEIVTYTINFSGACGLNCPTVLPVSLIDFYGTQNSSKNDIFWKVAGEENIKNYIIEKSDDGINFREFYSQKPLGSSNRNFNYYTEDTDPNDGITYYRLSTIEGSWSIKNLKIISVDRKNHDWKYVYYQQQQNLIVEFKGSVPKNSFIGLFDLSGQLIEEKEVNSSAEIIETSSISAGIYFVKITTPYKTENFKIIIQK